MQRMPKDLTDEIEAKYLQRCLVNGTIPRTVTNLVHLHDHHWRAGNFRAAHIVRNLVHARLAYQRPQWRTPDEFMRYAALRFAEKAAQ